MIAFTLLGNALSEAIGLALLHLLWQGAIVALILFVALRLIPRSSANLRYAAACAALVVVLGLGVATAWRSYEPRDAAGGDARRHTNLVTTVRGPVALDVESLTNDRPPLASIVMRYTNEIALVWMIGVLLLTVRLTLSWRRANLLVTSTASNATDDLQIIVARIGSSLGLRRAVRVLASAAVEVPSVIGWLRPAILVPVSSIGGLSPAQLEMILAHELAHIRRHDFLVNVLQSIAETLLFYHPAAWWISRQVRIERENCCDDLAVSVCGDALQYARALARLEQLRGVPLPAVAANGGSLFQRIRRLVRPSEKDRIINGWTAAAAAVLLVAVAGMSSIPALASRSDAPAAKSSGSTIEVAANETAPVAPRAARRSSMRGAMPAPPAPPAPPVSRIDEYEPEAPEIPEEPELMDEDIVIDIDHDAIADAVDIAMSVSNLAPLAMAFDGDDEKSAGKPAPSSSISGKLTVDELIALRVQNVTPEYMNQMSDAGLGNLTVRQLLAMRIQGVDSSYIASMRAAGVDIKSAKDAVALKVQGVDPAFVRAIHAAGYENLTVRDLVRLAASGVNADYIRDLSKYRTKK